MNETRALLDAFDAAIAAGERCALAMLVCVEGSAYRRPGARMLVTESGARCGSISAGCLEADVAERAAAVIHQQAANVVEYDTAATDDEMAWGLGLGCDGIIRVLIEPLTAASAYLDVLRRGTSGPIYIATIYRADAPDAVGARVVIEHDRSVAHGVDDELASTITHEVRARVAASSNAFDLEVGGARMLVETILPPVRLAIFGAGHDALPVVDLARQLGWQTEVVDLQAREATRARFPNADAVTLARPGELSARVTITPRTLALIVSHNYVHDEAALRFLLSTPACYIGVVGARKRAERLLADIGFAGDRDRLHAPAGLDIGAEGPMEIALSIVAEMRAVLDRRSGLMLRDRQGAMHARHDDVEAPALRLATG